MSNQLNIKNKCLSHHFWRHSKVLQHHVQDIQNIIHQRHWNDFSLKQLTGCKAPITDDGGPHRKEDTWSHNGHLEKTEIILDRFKR